MSSRIYDLLPPSLWQLIDTYEGLPTHLTLQHILMFPEIYVTGTAFTKSFTAKEMGEYDRQEYLSLCSVLSKVMDIYSRIGKDESVLSCTPKAAITVDPKNLLKVWIPSQEKPLATLQERSRVAAAALSEDQSWLIVATKDGLFQKNLDGNDCRRIATGYEKYDIYKIAIKGPRFTLFLWNRSRTFFQASLNQLDRKMHLFEDLEDPFFDRDMNRLFYWRREQEHRGVLEMVDVDTHKKTKIWEFDVLSGHHVNYGIQGNLLAITYGDTLVLWHCGQEQGLRQISLTEIQAKGELIAIDGTTLYFGYKRDALRRVKGQVQKQYVMRTLTFTDMPSLG